ncbi:tRNA1(Val) (adenine(37)-N6)-methyltransferase [Dyadobacter tibetensis]|uniref:tRNA1(Val) (adenine(37)-N6)-methyltransferase n=1 Tax=Dyadobacter tibetensis TaxID=1211851 RepID=UPI000471087B|nr:methyltransferase [Dyadobacter tibetensis]
MARNSFFQFKQFIIRQDRCAMKVCTDACIFGAWLSLGEAQNVLDIGSGTGLLTLMLAQRFPKAKVTGIELDAPAFEQSVQNVENSPYNKQIELLQGDIRQYEPGKLYESIISNPPFYQASLRSPSAQKNAAHHAETLHFEDLLYAVARLLKPEGELHLLLPWDESHVFIKMAETKGFILKQSLTINNHIEKKPFRRIMCFQRATESDNGLKESDLVIYSSHGQGYTSEFEALLGPFYLKL